MGPITALLSLHQITTNPQSKAAVRNAIIRKSIVRPSLCNNGEITTIMNYCGKRIVIRTWWTFKIKIISTIILEGSIGVNKLSSQLIQRRPPWCRTMWTLTTIRKVTSSFCIPMLWMYLRTLQRLNRISFNSSQMKIFKCSKSQIVISKKRVRIQIQLITMLTWIRTCVIERYSWQTTYRHQVTIHPL